MTGEGEPQGEWPESLPSQVSRLRRTLGERLYLTRAHWAVPAWLGGCFILLVVWQLIALVMNRAISRPYQPPIVLQFFNVAASLIAGVAYSTSKLIPMLAAVAPWRLVPRFLTGLLGCLALTFALGMYSSWSVVGFELVEYTLVFGVALVLAQRWGVRVWRPGLRRAPIELIRLTTADLLLLAPAFAVLFAVVGLIDRWFPTDEVLAKAVASALDAAYVWSWFLMMCLEYLAMTPLIWAVFFRRKRTRRIVVLFAMLLMSFVLQCLTTFVWWWYGDVAIPTGTVGSVLRYHAVSTLAMFVATAGLCRTLKWSGYRLVCGRA